MKYKNYQKIISGLLIFFLLFSITFKWTEFSFFPSKAEASSKENFNLVSVIVSEDIYSSVKSKLDRYAHDIEWVLKNTKVVIIPTPSNSSSFQIASLNESLYFDWLKSIKSDVEYESKLVWTVIVWKLPIPIVKNGDNYSKTILPYTDFEDKLYIFNHKTLLYEKKEDQSNNIKPEIWHWVISPNTWDLWEDKDLIKEYFDKNHKYYAWTDQFQNSKWIMNWKKSDIIADTYKPYVFYFNQIKEESAIDYTSYKWYEARLQYNEDLVYNRYTTDLARKIKEQVLWENDQNIKNLVLDVFPELILTWSTSTWEMLETASDLSTRYVTNKITKRFLEIFNSSSLSELKQNVFNAWRYSEVYDEVNADMPPFLISLIDLVSEQLIKNANDDLELKIDNIVKNWLSRKIPVFDSYTKSESKCVFGIINSITYTNYFYWNKTWNLSWALDCTIYRWSTTNSWVLVEANRWYNVKNTTNDSKVVSACWVWVFQACGADTSCLTRWFWGWNSSMNIDWNSKIPWKMAFSLKTHNLFSSITPIFDINWSLEIKDSSKTPSPVNCFSGVPLVTKLIENTLLINGNDTCEETYNIESKKNWACNTDNLAKGTTTEFNDFNKIYNDFSKPAVDCEIKKLNLDWVEIKKLEWLLYDFMWNDCPNIITKTYNYKTIPSQILHKSPTPIELKSQTKSITTPSLPIDKDRYIDFILANWSYQKIDYPYLYRLSLASGKVNNFENIEKLLETSLNNKSSEINSIISSTWVWDNIWSTYLKTGQYPSANVDLLSNFKNKPLKVYNIDWDSKEISYYDTLIFALYWKNLNSVSAKYKFIFENYLSDQFMWNNYKFWLPKNKKMYEMAYLWAPWDAENMYIKMDPNWKAENPYASIISANSALNNVLLWIWVTKPWDNSWFADSKCWPPDWVPIWQWIPAIICRLGTMMPPTIKIWAWSCGNKSIFLSQDELQELNSCNWDVNKNWINDCIETKLWSWSIDLTSDSSRYYYNTFWKLQAILKNKEWNKVNFDNSTKINFELEWVDLVEWDITKVIYSKDMEDEENTRKNIDLNYFWFTDSWVKVSAWWADYAFSTRWKDVNAHIKVYAEIKDFKWVNKIVLEKLITVEVRWDNFFATNYKITNKDWKLDVSPWSEWVLASDTTNIYLIDSLKKSIDDVKNSINNTSVSLEKLIFSLENYSKSGNKLPLSYPIKVDIQRNDIETPDLIEPRIINQNDLVNFKPFLSIKNSWNYTIYIKDKYGFSFSKNFVVTPDKAVKTDIWLGTTVLETGNVLTTHFVTIYDKYNNVANWEYYNIEWSITWNGLLFEETWEKTAKFQTLEWYRIFRLRSTNDEANNVLVFKIKDLSWNEILQTTKTIKTIKNLKLFVRPLQKQLKVWGGTWSYEISIKDENNNLVTDFNSRLYMTINPIYWTPITPYVDLKNWVWVVKLKTKNIASRKVDLEFQVEWLKSIYKHAIEILPLEPMKMDLSLSKSKLEASPNDFTTLKAELKDRYWNLVYTWSNNTILKLEVLDKYKSIIVPENSQKKVNLWTAEFKIKATDIPWIAYVKVSATPWFTSIFELEWQSPFEKDKLTITWFKNANWLTTLWKIFFEESDLNFYKSKFYYLEKLTDSPDYKKLTLSQKWGLVALWLTTNWIKIKPQSENATKIETFYFWNKNKINWNYYNWLYTTLLWANYWDISQTNYLAWSLIFDKDNRSLSVTSLLNNPYRTADVVSINSKWKISSIVDSKDLTQDLKFIPNVSSWKINFDIYNDALSTNVWKVFLNLWDNNVLKKCSWPALDFSDCDVNLERSSISMKSISSEYTTEEVDNTLVLKNAFWNSVFSINRDWYINKNTSIKIDKYDVDLSSSSVISIISGDDIVWLLRLNFFDWKFSFVRDYTKIAWELSSKKNYIVLYLETNTYWVRTLKDPEWDMSMIYYNDPFWSEKQLDNFSQSSTDWIENFENNYTVWWWWANKSLLLFASGESVWESTKKYASFSLINIWDPVVSLKPVAKKLPWKTINRKFDSSIWKLISWDSSNITFKVFDYNADNKEDIILVRNDSHIKLLENKDLNWDYLDKWNLVYLPEMWQDWIVEVWDFTWDSFDDVFYVGDWKPYLLNNVEKDFYKIPLQHELQFDLEWRIIQASAFDMDADWKTDIVTLDSAWEINIFYWWWTSRKPWFTKLRIWNWYSPFLSTLPRIDNWAVYWKWLEQLDNDKLLEEMVLTNEELLAKMKELSTNSGTIDFDERLIDNILFDKLPYSHEVKTSWTWELTTDLVQSINISQPNNPELWSYDTDIINWLTTLSTYSSGTIFYEQNENVWITTFVKSQYSLDFWIKVEKTFTDVNTWSLKWWDIVKVKILLTNTSWETRENMAYAEIIDKYFSLEWEDSIKMSSSGSILSNVWYYDFVVDKFSMPPNATYEINYEVTTLPLKYGHIETGLFEEWEVWNDIYGDVLLKPDDSSCAPDVDIYRSTAIRAYSKGLTTLTCDLDKLKLPWDLEKSKIDLNWNWIPDYIDDLINWWPDTIENYASWALNDLFEDTDWDWMPDAEDSTPEYDNNDVDTWDFLDDLNTKIDEISNVFSYISQWLCKWFGWGWCISTPMNWAPLAPGSDPTIFWFPIWDWLMVWEWLPIYSALTWITTYCWVSSCCLPAAWSPFIQAFIPWAPICWIPSAWWRLWIWSEFNVFRMFITPTLTGWVWTAICFWWPAVEAWRALFPWLYPLVQWWNCIVAAMPLIWCKWDWSDGDPTQYNYPLNYWNYSLLNWSCKNTTELAQSKYFKFDDNFIPIYKKYKKWDKSTSVMDTLKAAFKKIASGTNYGSTIPNWPLVSIWAWNDPNNALWNFSIEIDTNALKAFNFKNVIKIKNTWITDFPAFLMDWVDRQIEEIFTKLTSFPSLIVVLPDFSWIFDDRWWNFMENVTWKFNNWVSSDKSRQEKLDNDIDEVKAKSAISDCSSKNPWDEWYWDCMILSAKATGLNLNKNYNPKATLSWIKAVYEFLWNLPLLAFQSQTVNINVPWPDESSLTKTLISWEITKKQRLDEIENAKNAWSLWKACDQSNASAKQACEEQNWIWNKIILDAGALFNWINKNLETIEEYKKTPEKIVSLLNKKEERLQQVICNVNTITTLFWWRLWKNWERFKTWVETYILIKAVLKSWQLLVDLFNEYDQSCKECKNERNDLWTWIWKLISMILPKIPVIKFPKWPNIQVDLHNIRAWMIIALPEFNLNIRPIVLPSLPRLILPKVPNIWIKLPTIPLLPRFVIPNLPDLPTLPTIELPDLPPPPKLPKLFWSLEWILKILKLVTQIMCWLKKSPLVPEWRAWDQIANITERWWFLSLDFLDINMPEFSFPFVDVISVTSFVNLEENTDFLTEMAKETVKPINSVTNDINNIFKVNFWNLDFSNTVPAAEVNVNLWNSTWMNLNETNTKKIAWNVAKFIAYWVYKLVTHLNENKNLEVSSKEFLTIVNENLSKKDIVWDARNDKLRKLWEDVSNRTNSKENKLINDLQEKQKAKFDLVKSILNKEIEKTKKQKEYIKNLSKPNTIKFVEYENKNNIDDYNKMLERHNLDTVKATINLINDNDQEKQDLVLEWKNLTKRISWWLRNYKNSMLADATNWWNTAVVWPNACKYGWSYKYKYKWIYILENDVSYRLFDYLDELQWNEKTTTIDYDNDTDKDLLYMVSGELFLKENFEKRELPVNQTPNPETVDSWDNKFFNWDIFFEALNNTKESISKNNFINFSFDAPRRDDLHNFRLEFFNLVDKFVNQDYDLYMPEGVYKEVIDSFEGIDDATIIEYESWLTPDYVKRKNLAYIDNVWNGVKDAKLEWYEMINIRLDIALKKIVNLSSSTRLYAWKNPFTIKYYIDDENDKKEITVNAHDNIQFNTWIKIVSLTWNAYVQWKEPIVLKWIDIKNYVGLPLLPWYKISFDWNEVSVMESSHIDIKYYDETEYSIDFRYVNRYSIYDLWLKSDNYLISMSKANDFYYSKIYAFKDNILWTISSQILLSPQISSDTKAPEIEIDSWIRIPVYQKRNFDFSSYIYEESWIAWIYDFYIDFDLTIDSDDDWNTKNDRDIDKITIYLTTKKISADFWKYDNLFTKKIRLNIEDIAWNKWFQDVDFIVYSPIPKIDNYWSWKITWWLDEILFEEPVNVYRYRGWNIAKLTDVAWKEKTLTLPEWRYEFESNNNLKNGLKLTREINEMSSSLTPTDLATVDEYTWKITLKDTSTIEVLPSNSTLNDTSYVKFIVKNKWKEVYWQYFSFEKDTNLEIVDNFDNLTKDWIYLLFENWEEYGYSKNPLSLSQDPGVISIYKLTDKTKSLFSIFPNWIINTFNSNYKLEYAEFWWNVWLKLMNNWQHIASVVFKMIKGNYIMK